MFLVNLGTVDHSAVTFLFVQNDISDVLDLTFSMDADEEKLILYEKAEVPPSLPSLPCVCVCHGEPVVLSFLQAKSYVIFAGH